MAYQFTNVSGQQVIHPLPGYAPEWPIGETRSVPEQQFVFFIQRPETFSLVS